jgi:hypothetical protein
VPAGDQGQQLLQTSDDRLQALAAEATFLADDSSGTPACFYLCSSASGCVQSGCEQADLDL